MKISVIIPAYKARQYLPDCLDSIGRQTLLPKEIIVIDDASPEPMDDIVAGYSSRPGYPPIRMLRHKVNRGQAAGRNTGIQACNSEWVAFIDSDDIWAPDHLEQAVTTLNATDSDLFYCPATIFEENTAVPEGFVEGPMTPDEKALAPFALLSRCYIIMSSVVASAACVRAAGGFDEDPKMRAVEDLDLFMKLLKAGVSFAMGQRSTLFYRKHPGSATCTVGHMARQVVHVTERHINWVDAAPARKRLRLSEAYWIAALQTLRIGAEDRNHWLAMALCVSYRTPLLLLRKFARYLSQWLSGTIAGGRTA